MSLGLDIDNRLYVWSDRVKCIEEHSTEPWMLCSLYNGHVVIWNYVTYCEIKSFKVCKLPVRAAKFVCRKNWVITASDDRHIRSFNYNTGECLHCFEAHVDYIRCIVVHPTKPYILSASDDGLIKLWNWNSNWTCERTFKAHNDYVMQIAINPKDTNSFASVSLDKTVKFWQIELSTPNFTLQGHQRGINSLDFFPGDKPYLATGGDDRMIKIWDYQNKVCVYTLEGHCANIIAVSYFHFHLLLSTSEDGNVKIWQTNTYGLEKTVNFGMERAWALSSSDNLAIGYDKGFLIIRFVGNESLISMRNGKIIWIKNHEIQQVNLNTIPETEKEEGEFLPIADKELGVCEFIPRKVIHNCDGRFVAISGSEEYIIYTAKALRSKAFGAAKLFVWSAFSSTYATLFKSNTIKLFKNFKEVDSLTLKFDIDDMFGGYLLGVKMKRKLKFFDWDLNFIKGLELENHQPINKVFWSDSGNFVCLATKSSYYVLQYNMSMMYQIEELKIVYGVIDAFEIVHEINETITSGLWIGDCFLYTKSDKNVSCYIGGHIETLFHLTTSLSILGYHSKDSRLYMNDKKLNVLPFSLPKSILEYYTAIMRKDFLSADKLLPKIPSKHRWDIANFLQSQGHFQRALSASIDIEQKFDIALSSGNMHKAKDLLSEQTTERNVSHLWVLLGAVASKSTDTELMKICYQKTNDYSSLLLLASCTADVDLLREIAKNGPDNIAFEAYFLLNELEMCYEILIRSQKYPEAAFFARSYLPSKMTEAFAKWSKGSEKQILADPQKYPNLFPEI